MGSNPAPGANNVEWSEPSVVRYFHFLESGFGDDVCRDYVGDVGCINRGLDRLLSTESLSTSVPLLSRIS